MWHKYEPLCLNFYPIDHLWRCDCQLLVELLDDGLGDVPHLFFGRLVLQRLLDLLLDGLCQIVANDFVDLLLGLLAGDALDLLLVGLGELFL